MHVGDGTQIQTLDPAQEFCEPGAVVEHPAAGVVGPVHVPHRRACHPYVDTGQSPVLLPTEQSPQKPRLRVAAMP
ncbi:MAG: hypothetical protein QOI25_4234 [Mycobacterium sp.]|nr:hypothetical protein [Mycobacterium sp.]